MLELLRTSIQYIAPVFVISTMLHVGLTQKPSAIAAHLRNWPFLLKMLLANFVFAPLVMVAALHFAPFDPALKAGLLIFCLAAGSPFLVRLTQTAQHEVALGAAVMMMLMVVTVIYLPLVLPLLLSGISVDAVAIANALVLTMLMPIGIGMLLAQLLPTFANKAEPWLGKLGNAALYALVLATLIGYIPNMVNIVGTGAVLFGLVFVVAAFGIGYLAGAGHDHLEDVGGLGTAQRNMAAGVIVALGNFPDRNVFVMLTFANILGIVMLLFIARALSRDNKLKIEAV